MPSPPSSGQNRKLFYPLNEGKNSTIYPVSGTIVNVVPDFPADPEERVIVKLELSLNEFTQLASAIDVGRDIAYGDYSDNIWWLWLRAWQSAEVIPVTPVTPVTPAQPRFGGYFSDDSNGIDESEEDMPTPRAVKINGNWYLQIDCGCDDAVTFQLSPVALDSTGTPVSVSDGGQFGGGFSTGGGGAGGSWEQSGVSDVSCYADYAVPYMIARCIEFCDWLIDAEVFGIDWLLGQLDEWVEAAALAADFIADIPDLAELGTYAKEEVAAALNDTAVVDPLLAAWTFTGVPTRQELQSWVTKAPFVVDGIPVRLMFLQWLEYSFIPGYRNDLIQFAAACESGNPIPSNDVYEDFVDGGISYRLYSYNNIPITAVGETYLTSPLVSGQILAYVIDVDHAANGTTDFTRMGVSIPSIAVPTYNREAQDGNLSTQIQFASGGAIDYKAVIEAHSDITSIANWTTVSTIPATARTTEIYMDNKSGSQVVTSCRLLLLVLA